MSCGPGKHFTGESGTMLGSFGPEAKRRDPKQYALASNGEGRRFTIAQLNVFTWPIAAKLAKERMRAGPWFINALALAEEDGLLRSEGVLWVKVRR